MGAAAEDQPTPRPPRHGAPARRAAAPMTQGERHVRDHQRDDGQRALARPASTGAPPAERCRRVRPPPAGWSTSSGTRRHRPAPTFPEPSPSDGEAGRTEEGAVRTVSAPRRDPARPRQPTTHVKGRPHMSTTTDNPIRNGVDTATLFATLDAVKGNNEIAKFQFRASNTLDQRHAQPVDDPRLLRRHAGDGAHAACTSSTPTTRPCWSAPTTRPTPVEYLLHALAACLTAGIANIAAARGVKLTEVESTVEGDIDLLGILGLGDGRPQRLSSRSRSASSSRATTPTKLREVVEQSRRRSAVYDVLTNGVPVADRGRRPADADAREPTHRTVVPARDADRHRRPDRKDRHAHDRHPRHRRRPGRPRRSASCLTDARPRPRRARARPRRRALAQRALGLAAPAHPELDDPAARLRRTTGPTPTGS